MSGAQLAAVSALATAALQGLVASRRKAQRTMRSKLTRCADESENAEAEVSLASDAGVDYTKLKDLLSAGDFKEADAETRRLLIELAGKEAVKRGWVYFAEVRAISVTDMTTIDTLWQEYSGGKFGYSKQRKFWRQCRGDFAKFAEKVSWFTGKWENRNWPDEFIYDTTAPEGHLPLTNCIRGAQVLQELMDHPAFEQKKTARSASKVVAAAFMATRATSSSFAGGSQGQKTNGLSARAVSLTARHAAAETAPAPSQTSLESLELHRVINEHGLVLPDIPDLEESAASAFVIYDMNGKAQYMGFSKDLRNTLRTFLCRRPELCYSFRAIAFAEADQKALLALRSQWADEMGALPPGNSEPRQKGLWESPVDGGAMSQRAYKVVAEQKAKQIARQLKDRGLKENLTFKEDLIEQGKVDVVPSSQSIAELSKKQEAMAKNTAAVECQVGKKVVSFEAFFMSEFQTKGGWWFDVELSANKQKSSHRVIVGNDFAAQVDASPREIVEKCFAVLLANKVPRETDAMITSEVFPIAYFTASNVAMSFPELITLFQKSDSDINWDATVWNFKQVHDYDQHDKRTIPAGPMGGYFDPAGFQ